MSQSSELPRDPSATSASPSKMQVTTAELEGLSTASILALNDNDFDLKGTADRRELVNRISPTFQARLAANLPGNVISWDELKQLWRSYAAAEPDKIFNIVNVSTDIGCNGTAVVYVEVKITGVGTAFHIRMMEMKWRVINGKWMYYSCTTIGGGSSD